MKSVEVVIVLSADYAKVKSVSCLRHPSLALLLALSMSALCSTSSRTDSTAVVNCVSFVENCGCSYRRSKFSFGYVTLEDSRMCFEKSFVLYYAFASGAGCAVYFESCGSKTTRVDVYMDWFHDACCWL